MNRTKSKLSENSKFSINSSIMTRPSNGTKTKIHSTKVELFALPCSKTVEIKQFLTYLKALYNFISNMSHISRLHIGVPCKLQILYSHLQHDFIPEKIAHFPTLKSIPCSSIAQYLHFTETVSVLTS